MARPKEFDKDMALHKAIRLFSQQGFAATSTDQLMRVMDVGRQSMYDTFGDKRALFLRALERYVNESVNTICDVLEVLGPALAAIQKAFVSFAELKDLPSAEGCMGINAVCEFGQRDAEVNQIVQEAARRQRAVLADVLNRAKSQGELSDAVDVNSLADFFESTLAGIRVAAKGGKGRQTLRNIASIAGRVYGELGRGRRSARS
jgi:AcrR family transcriptional regulator